MRGFAQTVVLYGLVGMLVGCAHGNGGAASAAKPAFKLLQPAPGLYTSNQPGAGDWSVIRAKGVQRVIDLRMPGELEGRDEAAEVRAAGMDYIAIPVKGAEGLTRENAQLLHAALQPTHGQVLVHCGSANRAGSLLALEQAMFDDLPASEALQLGRHAGVTDFETKLKAALGLSEQE
jgi:uncharacterized protein (TIGR01244 family)